MKLNEFFNSELVSLPKGGFDDSKETFDQFLEGLFGRYLHQLQSVDDPEFHDLGAALREVVENSRMLAASLVNAVQSSLNGRVHVAYQEISNELSKIDWAPFRSILKETDSSIWRARSFVPI